jgi:hypothetical protein
MSETGPPSYKRLSLTVRPPRTAVAMVEGDGWVHSARRMVENFSRLWGGAGNVVLAIDSSGKVSETSWRLLEAFDADRLGYYASSWQGLRRANPDGFKRWLYRESRRLARNSSTTPREWREQMQQDAFMHQTLSGEPPEEVVAEALLRTSPYRWEHSAFRTTFTSDWTPEHAFPDLLAYEPVNLRDILVPDVSALSDELALLLEMRTGQISPSYEKELGQKRVRVGRPALAEAELGYALEYAWLGRTKDLSWLGGSALPDWLAPSDLPVQPFDRSLVGCGWFTESGSRWDERPYAIVVGNTLEDFSWAMMLDRLLSGAAWVPERRLRPRNARLARVMLSTLASAISTATRFGRVNRPVIFLSASLTSARLVRVIDATRRHAITTLGDTIALGTVNDVLSWMQFQRLLDREVYEVDRYAPFANGEMATRVETPTPSIVPPDSRRGVTWEVEVGVEDYRLPTRAVVDSLLLAEDTIDREVRASRYGISYFSQHAFLQLGIPFEKTLARPRLRLPEALEVFQALLSRGELEGRMSQAGRYSQEIVEVWSGIEQAAIAFRESATRNLLQGFLSVRPSATDPGVYLQSAGRRFLGFDDVRSLTGLSADETRQLLDDCADRGILSRGLILDCSHCSYDAWYALGELDEEFRCPRCRRASRLRRAAWRLPVEEPEWFYELSEVIYQGLKHNAHAPILALARLKTPRGAFQYAPEIEVWAGGERYAEFDLWAIVNGRIVVGEATTNRSLEQRLPQTRVRLQRLRRVAEVITADEVVLATTAAAWGPTLVAEAQSILGGNRWTVTLLQDLLAAQGRDSTPPS